MKMVSAFVAALIFAAGPARALDWKDFGGGPAADRTWKEFESPASEDEMEALGVDAELAEMMRNRTSGPPTLLLGADRDAPIGLQWPIEATASVALVSQLRAELAKRGFVLFVAERNFGTGPDTVGLVQAPEPVSLIAKRVVPPGMKSDDWIAQLRAWRTESPWDLVGVGEDWVEVEFREPLANPDRWVEEIARTAPAAVGEGSEGRVALRDTLVRTRRALLWWKLPEEAAPEEP